MEQADVLLMVDRVGSMRTTQELQAVRWRLKNEGTSDNDKRDMIVNFRDKQRITRLRRDDFCCSILDAN